MLKNLLYSVFRNRCPQCHKGKVFTTDNPYNLRRGLAMETQCAHCNVYYEREPGFFYGAMYITYGLIVGWILFLFAIAENFMQLDNLELILGIIIFLLSIVPINFRCSRLVWLNFFVKRNVDSL